MFQRLSAEPIYNTRAVVQRTGVPADTFRAWERRYGVPIPSRTSGNQRLYSERDIGLIAWLRDQTCAGMTISQAVALLRSQAEPREQTAVRRSSSQLAASLGSARPDTDPVARFAERRDELVSALTSLDGTRADRIVEDALAMSNVEQVCLHVLQATLIEIGRRWEHGEANIAVEHFAASYVQRKFGSLFNQSNPNEGRGPIVAACPEGELHDIGLLLNCVFLSRRGYRILYLGANLPTADLIQTLERVQPPLVILSATREETARKISHSAPLIKRAVADVQDRDLPEIGFGGNIFIQRPDLRLSIDGTYLGVDAHETVCSVDRIFASLPA